MSLFVTYTLIQSITSSEMYSLHLTHPSAHTHLEQWAAEAAESGEQLGVRCLAQGSHLSHGQFLPEPRFEPTTSGYKSDGLSIRSTTALIVYIHASMKQFVYFKLVYLVVAPFSMSSIFFIMYPTYGACCHISLTLFQCK